MNRLQWEIKEHRERTLRNHGDGFWKRLKWISRNYAIVHYLNWTEAELLENEEMFKQEHGA